MTYTQIKSQLRTYILTFDSNAEGIASALTALLTVMREVNCPDELIKKFERGYLDARHYAEQVKALEELQQ